MAVKRISKVVKSDEELALEMREAGKSADAVSRSIAARQEARGALQADYHRKPPARNYTAPKA